MCWVDGYKVFALESNRAQWEMDKFHKCELVQVICLFSLSSGSLSSFILCLYSQHCCKQQPSPIQLWIYYLTALPRLSFSHLGSKIWRPPIFERFKGIKKWHQIHRSIMSDLLKQFSSCSLCILG